MKQIIPCVVSVLVLAGVVLMPGNPSASVTPAQSQAGAASPPPRPSAPHVLNPIAFDIRNNRVIPKEGFSVRVQVLGSAITDHAGPMPVTTRLTVAGQRITPWGAFDGPAGNVNLPGKRPTFIVPTDHPAGSAVTIAARSWHSEKNAVKVYADSALPLNQVQVLRDGDPLPAVESFANPASLPTYLSKHIKDNHLSLHANQVIYLYELSTLDLNSPDADFQDLILLVTLGKNVQDLEQFED